MCLYIQTHIYINVFHWFDENVSAMSSIHPSIFIHSLNKFIKPLLCAKICVKSWDTTINTIYFLSLSYSQVNLGEGYMNNNNHPAWWGKNEHIYGVKMLSNCAELWHVLALVKQRGIWSDHLLKDSVNKAWGANNMVHSTCSELSLFTPLLMNWWCVMRPVDGVLLRLWNKEGKHRGSQMPR